MCLHPSPKNRIYSMTYFSPPRNVGVLRAGPYLIKYVVCIEYIFVEQININKEHQIMRAVMQVSNL